MRGVSPAGGGGGVVGSRIAASARVRSSSVGPRGLYSTKAKVCEAACDTMGVPVAYEASPYAPPSAAGRDPRAGRGFAVPQTNEAFGKLEHADEPFEPAAAEASAGEGGDAPRKLGFCVSGGRVAGESSREARRWQDALSKEARFAKLAAEATAARSAAQAGGGGGGVCGGVCGVCGGASPTSSPAPPPAAPAAAAVGLRAALPRCASGYDRSRYVSEFVPKVAYAVRYARDYGGLLPSSAALGEGCSSPSALVASAHTVRDFSTAFDDRVHLMAPSIAGWPAPA